MWSSAEAPERLDPLIDSIVGYHHEDEIDDDGKQFGSIYVTPGKLFNALSAIRGWQGAS